MKHKACISKYGISNDIPGFLETNYRLAIERSNCLPPYLKDIIAQYGKNDYILDIGCGVGGDLSILKQHNFKHLYGVELVPEALEFAHKKFHLSSVVRGNCESLPFRTDRFNCCMATNIIEHILFPSKLMKEIHRVLVTGGLTIINVPRASSLSDTILRWGGVIMHGKTSHIQRFDLKKAKGLFLKHGFIILKEEKNVGFDLDSPLFKQNLILKAFYGRLERLLRNELNGWRFTLKKN
jgi:SAM-dependent methyltransferase